MTSKATGIRIQILISASIIRVMSLCIIKCGPWPYSSSHPSKWWRKRWRTGRERKTIEQLCPVKPFSIVETQFEFKRPLGSRIKSRNSSLHRETSYSCLISNGCYFITFIRMQWLLQTPLISILEISLPPFSKRY